MFLILSYIFTFISKLYNFVIIVNFFNTYVTLFIYIIIFSISFVLTLMMLMISETCQF